jgi:hypothetical protein
VNTTDKIKKFLVLGILFLLPITAYIFFASGVNNFAKLPILTHSISELDQFKSSNEKKIVLQDRITVLGFFGSDVEASHANAFNLAHKIYKKNFQFKDFQFVILMPEGTQDEVKYLKLRLAEIENPENWNFVYGSPEAIETVFNSLETNYSLDSNFNSPYVFIIDKDRNLRGRDDDEDEGVLFGFNAQNYSEINNKMSDDVNVILAEYRLALKKYNSKSKKEDNEE